MEIPAELKSLYSHWPKHTTPPNNLSQPNVELNAEVLNDVIEFSRQRMFAWENKIAGHPKPYSSDPILAQFRFCNIYRELDAQTIQIHRDISQFKDNFNLWLLNLAFHRFICRPQTVAEVGHLSFDMKNNLEVMRKLQQLPRPKYGTAYVFPISVIQRSQFPTREEFFCLYLPQIIPTIAQLIESFSHTTVNAALTKILPVFGFNFKFHWTEILIDVAYQFPKKINLFSDFHVGPGAIPTLDKLSDSQDPNAGLNQLATTEMPDFPYLTYEDKPVYLSAENWEGICCEYRKYTNLQDGKGRRRRYS